MGTILRAAYYTVAAASVVPTAAVAGALAVSGKLSGCHPDDQADRDLAADCRRADSALPVL
jgi:hypothetical protein